MTTALTIPPFYTMEMMKLAAELEQSGRTVYHLEVGQSVVPTPQAVREEAQRLLQAPRLDYCSALGVMELREAIAQHYADFYQLSVEPECVVVTPGSSLGLYIALLMNFKRGDTIAIAVPSYPCYKNVIESLGLTVVGIKTSVANGYLMMADDLAECGQAINGILIASPNNPTGSVYDAESLKQLADYCQARRIQIISDEIYHGIDYGNQSQSILQYDPMAMVINGFSKYFAMTGWRVGWMIVDKTHIKQYENLLQNMILCACPLTQRAAIKAFDCYDELNAHVHLYRANLELVYSTLYDCGLTRLFKAKGGFYLYVELDQLGLDLTGMALCQHILSQYGVAVAPGLDFSSEAACAIRISFCQSREVIEQACIQLRRFLQHSQSVNVRLAVS